jgi:hypothetical protein
MVRLALLTFACFPVLTQGASRFNLFAFADRSAAMLLIAALFYFGFKWRTR